MSGFKTIETQEELDRSIGELLARQKEKYGDYDELKQKAADYEKLETRVTELETENGALKSAAETSKASAEDYDKQIEDLKKQVAGYETASLRTRIALQNGLPIDLADRLVGDNEEAIKADAERLAGFMKRTEPIAPMKSNEPTLPTDEDDKRAIYRDMVQNLTIEN